MAGFYEFTIHLRDQWNLIYKELINYVSLIFAQWKSWIC